MEFEVEYDQFVDGFEEQDDDLEVEEDEVESNELADELEEGREGAKDCSWVLGSLSMVYTTLRAESAGLSWSVSDDTSSLGCDIRDVGNASGAATSGDKRPSSRAGSNSLEIGVKESIGSK
ncbi:hypothetical protein QAD02_018781 [Eretmocerus hayati]|uniref:Uncharacterized protein n=1 Tax=Eretmocerus hayati TaxID=131215 RepID=A0ACC2PHB8_9HYME|nr:hypothetical protein QAD02_018781 [Eretmocerus hayati]